MVHVLQTPPNPPKKVGTPHLQTLTGNVHVFNYKFMCAFRRKKYNGHTHVVRLKFAKSSGIRPIKSIRSQLPSVRSFATTTTDDDKADVAAAATKAYTRSKFKSPYNNRRRRLYNYKYTATTTGQCQMSNPTESTTT